MSDIIAKLTLDNLREVFQNAGYRIETITDPVAGLQYLRSATAGLSFDIRPGNRLLDGQQEFVDAALVALLQVEGNLPLEIVNLWNSTRRFGRLQLSQPMLMLCLDLTVAGGVTADYLRAQIEIWDRLVHELITYLRHELSKLGAARGTASAAEPAERADRLEPRQDTGSESRAPLQVQ